MELFEMPSMVNVREICPENDDESIDNNCTSTRTHTRGINAGDSLDQTRQHTAVGPVSDSRDTTALKAVDTAELSAKSQAGALLGSSSSSEVVANNADLMGFSVDESQAIVDFLFDTS
jgi:hypothetical protein